MKVFQSIKVLDLCTKEKKEIIFILFFESKVYIPEIEIYILKDDFSILVLV